MGCWCSWSFSRYSLPRMMLSLFSDLQSTFQFQFCTIHISAGPFWKHTMQLWRQSCTNFVKHWSKKIGVESFLPHWPQTCLKRIERKVEKVPEFGDAWNFPNPGWTDVLNLVCGFSRSQVPQISWIWLLASQSSISAFRSQASLFPKAALRFFTQISFSFPESGPWCFSESILIQAFPWLSGQSS